MISCQTFVFLVKTGSNFFIDQASDYQQANLIAYQCLIRKFIYLSCETHPHIAFMIR